MPVSSDAIPVCPDDDNGFSLASSGSSSSLSATGVIPLLLFQRPSHGSCAAALHGRLHQRADDETVSKKPGKQGNTRSSREQIGRVPGAYSIDGSIDQNAPGTQSAILRVAVASRSLFSHILAHAILPYV